MEWTVTMRNPQGLLFMDYFEGKTESEVQFYAEQYYSDSQFVSAEIEEDKNVKYF
jgi:hypothetical protein